MQDMAKVIKATDSNISSYHVTLRVFSGTRDPEWVFKRDSAGYAFLNGRLPEHSSPLDSRLGYNGYTIDMYQGTVKIKTMTVGRCSDAPSFETGLLDVVKTVTPLGWTEPLSENVYDYVRQDIASCLISQLG